MDKYLVIQTEDGRVLPWRLRLLLPDGAQILGAHFGRMNTIVVNKSADQVFTKDPNVSSWTNGQARFLYEHSTTGNLRLGELGEYTPEAFEFPVAAVYGIDVHGSVLTYSLDETPNSDYLVKFLLREVPSLIYAMMAKTRRY